MRGSALDLINAVGLESTLDRLMAAQLVTARVSSADELNNDRVDRALLGEV
jgi:hypothetical protein